MENPWSTIEKPDNDFNVRLVGGQHPLRLFWGRDTFGRYLFIYATGFANIPEKKVYPNLLGITLNTARDATGGKLVIRLNETANWELFHALCADLVRATSGLQDGPTAGAVIVRRLNRWQELFKKARSGVLPLDSIKGLIGELLFLADRLAPEFGWDEAVSFWKGPEGSPQDFAAHQIAIEIKCQAGSSKPHIRINSAEQLEPQLPEGYLTVFTIAGAKESEDEGFTLNDLVGRIRSELEAKSQSARERFEDLLFMAGYVTTDEYDELRFSVIAVKCFHLQEGFPRIRSSELISGIENVSYTLSLEACAGFEGRPEWWREPS
jgi:hypothetical protein